MTPPESAKVRALESWQDPNGGDATDPATGPDGPASHLRSVADDARRQVAPARRPGRAARRRFRDFHRWTGLLAGALLFAIAVTGILINHAGSLGLDERKLRLAPLVALYGLPAEPPAESVRWSGGEVFGANGTIALGDARHPLAALRGVAPLDDMLVVAGGSELLLLMADGELVERLAVADLVPPIARAGVTVDGRAAIQDGDGVRIADDMLLAWTPGGDAASITWFEASPVDPTDLPEDLRGPTVTWERVLLDLHSGRLFGLPGTLLNDLAALAIIYLFVSGLITWRRNGRAGRRG